MKFDAYAAVVAVAMIIAGCASPVETDAAESAPTQATLQFGAPISPPHDESTAEPNMAVLEDGTIFVTAPAGLADKPGAVEGSAWLWRSTDGVEFELLRGPSHLAGNDLPNAPLGTSCSCDADVTARDGWVYYTDWWIPGIIAPGNYLVERSNDGGDTWDAVPVTIPIPEGAQIDRQWLTAGYGGQVLLTYLQFGEVQQPMEGWEIRGVMSNDYGATWSQSFVIQADDGGAPLHGHPFVLPGGEFVVPYGHTDSSDYLDDAGEVRVAISSDGGQEWDIHVVGQVDTKFDGIWPVAGTVDSDGTMHVAWSAQTGDGSQVWLATSNDGQAWSSPVSVSGPGYHALPWLAASPNGELAIGWFGGDYEGDPAHAGPDVEWFAFVATRQQEGWATHKLQEDPVKEGEFCPRGAACRGDRELLDYLSLAYLPDGRLAASYADEANGFAQVKYVEAQK